MFVNRRLLKLILGGYPEGLFVFYPGCFIEPVFGDNDIFWDGSLFQLNRFLVIICFECFIIILPSFIFVSHLYFVLCVVWQVPALLYRTNSYSYFCKLQYLSFV